MALNRIGGFRGTARVLHVSPSTVIRELLDTASELAVLKQLNLNKLKSKFVCCFQLKRLMDLNLNWMRCGLCQQKKSNHRWLWHAMTIIVEKKFWLTLVRSA